MIRPLEPNILADGVSVGTRQVILARLFIPLLFPYEPKVEANQKEHEVDDAPQSQQFWGNGKPKKRNSQVSKIEIRVYPSANKKRTGEKFTDLFPINAHNSKRLLLHAIGS